MTAAARLSARYLSSLIIMIIANPALAEPLAKGDFDAGKRIYMSNCEVCHLIGRNLLNPNKEIQNSKLLDDPKKLKEFLSKKNSTMPPFMELSRDDKQLKDLNQFLHYARRHPSEVFKETDNPQINKTESKEEPKSRKSELPSAKGKASKPVKK